LSSSFIPLKMQDPELVNQLKATLPEALFEKLNGSLSIDRDRLRFAEYKVRVLEERLRLVQIEKYGPDSERLSDAQLELLELEAGVSSAEVEAESQREQLQLPLRAARKHPGRQELPADLPRVEQLISCTPQQCVCGKCGKQTVLIGYETSEQLDVEPAKYFVRVTKREKRACKACEEQGVQSAPLPARIIDKGLASDRVVIDTVVSKYADHVPLYRQSVILERETGIEMPRATLDGWVMRVGELLRPITAAMSQELLRGDYIQADETPVNVQMHDSGGKNHQAYLWQYSRPGGAVVFDFRMGREREGPNGSWATSRASSKVTVTGLTIMSVEPESSTPRAGRTPDASSSKRSNSIPEIKLRSRIVAQMDELFYHRWKGSKGQFKPQRSSPFTLGKSQAATGADQDSGPGSSW
jgi:transposase